MTSDPNDPGAALAGFEEILSRVVGDGLDVTDADFEEIRRAGARAAEEGMSAQAVVDLYLASAAHAWSSIPPTRHRDAQSAARSMLDGIRAAVPVLVDGYHDARQQRIQHEETARREFIDDLMHGDGDAPDVIQRAEPFGIDLTTSHQVVLAEPRDGGVVDVRDETVLRRAVIERYGNRDVLVTTKGGHLTALVPTGPAATDVDEPARHLHAALAASARRRLWRVAVGRPYPGAHGVARSYEQAREAIVLAQRLHPHEDMVHTRDLLIYRVLGRDRVALADLVESVLTPLSLARGGAAPLLETLEAYFDSGCVATKAAHHLHVSVRTVTYRLAKIDDLTGFNATNPAQRLTLQASVVGARLLPWTGEATPAR